jgi:hypothetical protein
MAMPLHFLFYRTIGPAVYGGAGAVAETNWAEEMATYLSGTETSAASLDFKQQSYWIDNQTSPGKSGTGKRTKGGPWTTDADDYTGTLVDALYDTDTWGSAPSGWQQYLVMGENGYFQLPPMNAMNGSSTSVSNATDTTDSETAPDGTNPRLITNTSTTGYAQWTGCTNGEKYVWTQYGTRLICWLKSGSNDIVQIRYGTGGADYNSERYLNVDLSDGTIGDTGSHVSSSTASAVEVSNGYRKVVADLYFGTTTNTFPVIRIRTVPSLTSAYAASSSGTGETFYWWRCQHTHPWCVDEYIDMSPDTYMRSGPLFVNDADGNSYGVFSSTSPGTVNGVNTDLTATDYGDWATATTATNCTVSSSQAMSIFPTYDVGGLITGSNAGGTGTVSIEFEPFSSTAVAGGDAVTSFIYLKAGTATKGYVSFTDSSGTFFDGNESLVYFDLSKGQLYDPEIEEPQTIEHTDYTFDPFLCKGAALVKVDSDWWCMIHATYQTGSYNIGAYTLGLCDSVGSKTRTLNGATMYFHQGTYISDIGSDPGYCSVFPVLLFAAQETSDWVFQTRVVLDDRIEFDPTSYSLSFAYIPSLANGDAQYAYLDSNVSYHTFQSTGNTMSLAVGGTLFGSIAASTAAEQQDFGGGGYQPGVWNKFAWSSDGDARLVNRWNITMGTDSGYTPSATVPAYFGLGGIVDSLTILNRVPTESDLQDICHQKTLSVQDNIYCGGADLLVLKQDDNTTGIEVTNLAALVLRSTAGT